MPRILGADVTDTVPGRPPTAADVALHAGVSKATATRALGDYGRISQKTKQRVLAAADELGYRPNAAAQTMNTGKSGSLGIVARGITNPVWSVAFQGIVDAARESGKTVLFAGSGFDVAEERSAIDLFLGKQVDGLIVSAADNQDARHLRRAREHGVPLVLWERRVPGLDAPVVEADMRSASAELARELLKRGHRRVAFVSTLAQPTTHYERNLALPASIISDKIEGLFDAFDEANVAAPVDLVRFPNRTSEHIAKAFAEVLDHTDPPTALVASDSQVAETMLEVVRERGLRVPGDVSLAMFDNLSWARFTVPPLTVVAQPDYDMGRRAAQLAMGQIAPTHHSSGSPPFEAKLILRASVGPAPRNI
ncbi:LacI family transcriptional regulator [Lacisediminihabitans profunda]|uniref:LacI family transcriptional regulator n=1 Tax=Lacisediminihabitans profunda TaxID=2594790 RepID=A0A5C8UQF3_9MICO|nr:LacI family transcriptional regulator [Lacisediminihabitans profunda]